MPSTPVAAHRCRAEDGRPLRADTFAILGVGQNRRVETFGWTDRPLLLTDDDTTGFICVEADGYFAARADVAATEQDVVLRRGTAVAVQVRGAPAGNFTARRTGLGAPAGAAARR